MVADCPALGLPATETAHCWKWCGGWVPERWALYASLYPVTDWDLLIDCLQVIRTHTANGHRAT